MLDGSFVIVVIPVSILQKEKACVLEGWDPARG